MDFEVTNVLSVSEHFVIVELKGLPTPLLLKDVCSVPVPVPIMIPISIPIPIPTTTAQSSTPSIAGTPTPHTETQQNLKPEQKETPVAVFDFEKCLKSRKPSDFESMVKVMDSGIDNLNIQIEACNALAHAQLKPTGIIFMCSKYQCQQTKRWMVW